MNKFFKNITMLILMAGFIFMVILIGNPKGPKLYNSPITITSQNTIESSIQIYNYKQLLFYFNGWEAFLDNTNTKSRILGTNYQENIQELNNKQYLTQSDENQIKLIKDIQPSGFFQKETAQKAIETYKQNKNQITKISWYNPEKDPKAIGYIFTIPKTLFATKPYFKLQFFAEVKNPEQLKEAGYGMAIRGYDIYLPNNKILKNDYERIETNEPKEIYIEGEKQNQNNPTFQDILENKIILKGTNHKTKTEYQIFYNQDKAIIIWGEFDYIDNLFKWEVFRPFFTKKENPTTFKPLYIAILNQATLNYQDNTYIIQSKEFNGDVNTLIKDWTF